MIIEQYRLYAPESEAILIWVDEESIDREAKVARRAWELARRLPEWHFWVMEARYRQTSLPAQWVSGFIKQFAMDGPTRNDLRELSLADTLVYERMKRAMQKADAAGKNYTRKIQL